ncbi:MAG: TonB family protein [Bacteroidota bacterium]
MTNFADFLFNTGQLSLEHLWLPLLFWTLFAGLFYLADRSKLIHAPQIRYQAATALLLALPIGILLSFAAILSVSAPAPSYLTTPDTPLVPDVGSVASASPVTPDLIWHTYHLVGIFVLLIGAIALFKTSVLLRETLYLRWMGQTLRGDKLAAISPAGDAVRKAWGLSDKINVVFSDTHAAPMTFGWRTPVIVVPESLRNQPHDLHLALLHELAHIRNADFARKWIERLTASWFFFHPLVHNLVQRLAHFREMNCDQEVLSRQDVSPRQYASLLLNFAAPQPVPAPLPLSMSANKNSLKNRISAMKDYSIFSPSKRRTAFYAAMLLLFCTSVLIACEVNFVDDNSVTVITTPDGTTETEILERELAERELIIEQQQADPSGEVFMIVEEMPVLIGGLAGIQALINYPDAAKAEGIEGRVFVQFVVDTNGQVTDPVIVRGIGAGCDEEALRAVSQARFVPGRQRGQVVKVKMSLPVTFRLSDETAEAMQGNIDLISKLMAETQLKMSESQLKKESLAEQMVLSTFNKEEEEMLVLEKKLREILVQQSAYETQLKGLKEVYEKMLAHQNQIAS